MTRILCKRAGLRYFHFSQPGSFLLPGIATVARLLPMCKQGERLVKCASNLYRVARSGYGPGCLKHSLDQVPRHQYRDLLPDAAPIERATSTFDESEIAAGR